MIRPTSALAMLLALASCSTPDTETRKAGASSYSSPPPLGHKIQGPLAVGVSPDAPKDSIGVLLGWRPDQTIENFKHFDQIFSVRAVKRGAHPEPLVRKPSRPGRPG